MKLRLYGSIAFLLALMTVLHYRYTGDLADPAASVLALVCVVGFAGCTLWSAIAAMRVRARQSTR
jgi:hypothetical protein